MLLKRVIIVLAFGFGAQTIVSCICSCNDSHQCFYNFSSLTTSNIDTSGLYPVVSNLDTIPKSNFGLKLDFGLTKAATCKIHSRSMFSEANAKCLCPPAIVFNAQDTIASFVITTINNFDGQHPATTDVTEYFKVLVPGSVNITVADFLKQKEISFGDITSGESIALLLTTPPLSSSSQSFKIDITLASNATLTHTSKSVYLK